MVGDPKKVLPLEYIDFDREGAKMRDKAFKRLLTQLQTLTFTQTKKVEEHLHKKCSIESLEDVTGEVDRCPHCQSKAFNRWGSRSGLQRGSAVKHVIRPSACSPVPLSHI